MIFKKGAEFIYLRLVLKIPKKDGRCTYFVFNKMVYILQLTPLTNVYKEKTQNIKQSIRIAKKLFYFFINNYAWAISGFLRSFFFKNPLFTFGV